MTNSNFSPLPFTPARLGIIAGRGDMPRLVAETARHQGRNPFILALEGEAETGTEPWISTYPHAWVRMGAVGESLHHLEQAGVQHLVMIGGVRRPSLKQVFPDKEGAKLLARLTGQWLKGDDALLRTIAQWLEERGFTILSAADVMAQLLAPAGIIGGRAPTAEEMADIERGATLAHQLGAADIGQAVMLQAGYVLAVEAAEGTDALIRRAAELRREPSGGVLVKACKPQQDKRLDLPSIGPDTVKLIKEHGFSGIAVEAGASLIARLADVRKLAEETGIFIYGFTHQP
jgi:DUF1009 family protein